MSGPSERVSLIATVLNEYGSIPSWLDGFRCQSRLPDELIVVDGGSTDGTVELIQDAWMPFPFTVVSAPGVTIAQGRNIAIARTSGSIVVVTDAGTRARPNWLERLVAPFENNPDTDAVAGFFGPVGEGWWASTLGATTLPDAHEVDEDRFLPSSRSFAFRRGWFENGFSYPEWLDYCEDLVFNLQIREAGARQAVETRAIVDFIPRSGPVSFARQYYRYARGDGLAGLFAPRHVVRYTTYLIALIILRRRRTRELLCAGLLAAVYLRRPVQRCVSRGVRTRRDRYFFPPAIALIAMQRLIGDVAKMAGYPAGVMRRVAMDRSLKLWKTGWKQRRPDGSLRRI